MWKKKYGEDFISGHNVYRTFKKAVKLSVVRQQNDPEFCVLLMRIRNGKIRKTDFERA